MKYQDPKELEIEKQVLAKHIKLFVWAGLPVQAFVFWLVAFLSCRYLGTSIGLFEVVPIILSLWLVDIGDKILRIRQINKELSVPKKS